MNFTQKKGVYSKSIISLLVMGLLVSPFGSVHAIGNDFSQNNNPYAFNIENASSAFDSVIGCTITTESVSNAISKVLTKGQKFGAKTNARFQEIFNSNKDDTVNFTLSEDDIDRYYWKATSDDETLDALTRFTESTSYLPGEPVIDAGTRTNTKESTRQQEELNKKAAEELKEAELKRVREQCLNGVAYTLAKRQLAKITNDTLNWVNTGLDGDPLFVRDQVSYLQNVADQKLIEFLKPVSSSANSTIYPYGRSFARGALQNRSTTFEQRSVNTLSRFLPNNAEPSDWSNDFSQGGWNAWLAFTQNPANNPLGYQLIATEELAKRQREAEEAALNEISNGFLPEKQCVEWSNDSITSVTDDDGTTIEINNDELDELHEEFLRDQGISTIGTDFEKPYCLRWETITPGSVIENQVNTTLTSSIRQLELADSINESLGVLFQSLLTKLMDKGLKNLDQTIFEDFSQNGTSSISEFYDSLGNNLSLLPGYSSRGDILNVNQGSGVNVSNFDLTIDLGDVTGTIYYEGCQDLSGRRISCLAQNNPLDSYKLNTIVLDECSDGIDNDNDGLSDSEDPTCSAKNTGVVKKGLIRIQNEYIQAVKESRAELPNIMPALGELDYCIPGPNPGWRDLAIKEANAQIEFLRSLDITSDGSLVSAFGEIKDLEKAFAESKAGNGLQTAGQIAPIVGSAFGPPGTAIGSLIGLAFGIVGKDQADRAQREFEYQVELKKRYIDSAANNFEKDRARGITRIIKSFNSYENDYENLYGKNSPMRTPSTLFAKNSYYLPMANSGLELTENMTVYARNIDKAEKDYSDLISSANANVYKLEEIKRKVDIIVRRARARRAEDIRTGRLVIPAECRGLVDLGVGITVNGGGGINTGNGNATGGGGATTGGGLTGGGNQTGGGGTTTGGGSNPQ